MKNLFERDAVDEVIARIDSLRPATQRQWGKMDVAQMMATCSGALDMASGRLNPRASDWKVDRPAREADLYDEKPFCGAVRRTRNSLCRIHGFSA